MKPGDKNTFPIIFLTVRRTPRCAVKQAHKVQDQCKSKCYFSLPPLLALTPLLCSGAPLQPRHAAAQCPRHPSPVQRIISRCIFFEKVLSCETQRKHSNTNWHLILQAPYRCQLCRQRGGGGMCCVGGGGGQGGLPDRKWSLAERRESDGRLLKN